MTAATCPACGVAVVPGYVKCPKCHTALPRTVTRKDAGGGGGNAGGTAVQTGPSVPWVPIVLTVVVAGGIILFFSLRKPNTAKAEPPPPTAVEPGPAPEAAPAPTPSPTFAPAPSTAAQPAGPTAADVTRDLRRALEQRRLWSTVTVGGDSIEVRGTSCTDKQMGPTIDAIRPNAHAAGLTKLRCVEQSGAVVFARDL